MRSRFLATLWLSSLFFGYHAGAQPSINLKDYTARYQLSSPEEDLADVVRRRDHYPKPPNAVAMQQWQIPVYDLSRSSKGSAVRALRDEMYDVFFRGPGVIILKGVFSKALMDRFNTWCEHHITNPKLSKGLTHPKQKDKRVINDVLERASGDAPEMLAELLTNTKFSTALDNLLGFYTIGAYHAHWIQPGGKRQFSHVDYPTHVGSGAFWENSPQKMMDLMTPYQLDHIFPYMTVQALIASDAMGPHNGSTNVVPHSQHIRLLDLKLHSKEFENTFRGQFVQPHLDQGDVIVFNRRLYHAGGHNRSAKRRNSLIIQAAALFAVGQHQTDVAKVMGNLRQSGVLQMYSPEAVKRLELRLRRPYPIDTANNH